MRRFWKNYLLSVNRVRQARGFGVHSPFAFRLITKVIREKARYYAYDEIISIKGQYVAPILTRQQQRLRKMILDSRGRLLFRLTNFFQPHEILEVGTAWGISSLYLRKVSQTMRLTVVEPVDEINRFARQLFAQVGESAEFIEQSYSTYLPAYCQEGQGALYIIVNRLPGKEYEQLPQLLSAAIDRQSILILDGIRSHDAAMKCWNILLKDERVRVTFDLKNMGLICCNAKLNKQNYRIKL